MKNPPSILLLLPFFGPLPASMPFFLRSCASNVGVSWLLITDQAVDARRLPRNVKVRNTTFRQFKKTADRALGFETTLPFPYKLCDFKPAYGVICAEDLSGFDFWGHCDLDVIFGDILRFLTPDILMTYSKVLIHGHLSLYRNCDEANNYFRLETSGVDFRKVFTSPKSWAFDEFGGIRLLLKDHNIPFFRNDDYLADIDRNSHRLTTVNGRNHRHQCFYWEDGRVFRAFWDGSGIERQEYMYLHLPRRMDRNVSGELAEDAGSWYITPHGFLSKASMPSGPREMDRLNPGNILYDAKRRAATSMWRLKKRMSSLSGLRPIRRGSVRGADGVSRNG
jgi:hypothetical protein